MAKGLKMSDLDLLDEEQLSQKLDEAKTCLLYTSDAADDLLTV